MTAIDIKNLKKAFDGQFITRGVNLEVPAGKSTVIIGKSGEGKSVLLKQIIGLIKPTSGEIIVNGRNITTLTAKELDEHYQQMGYVFQFAALLDSLTVFENIGITLLEQGVARDKVRKIVREKLALTNLKDNVLHKYPSELSGGMRKRVGLARTLVANPSIILYDEPTTGLDPITTRVIHELIHSMQEKLGVTSVVISHDVDIFNYTDHVAMLNEGKIVFSGDAQTIWDSDNPYVYQFIRGLPEGPLQMEANPQ